MISQERRVLTVSNVNNYIKSLLTYDANLSNMYVSGEISNFKIYSAGHAYFSLKDPTGVLKCVMFRTQVDKLTFVPSDGMKVVCFGSVNVYEKTGEYQLYVQRMEQDGLGTLYEQFEALKKKLESEGLFDPSHKKAIPRLPKAVGVVTSDSGAVYHDILNVSGRRFPDMPIILYPSQVQGKGAENTIANAIARANQEARVDVLIVGRGGGSIEDLWPFNEEVTARAVYNSQIPVISAVGHETDFTICDFASDLRAPTPSAAAELAVPEYNSLMNDIIEYEIRLKKLPASLLELKKAEIERLAGSKCFTSLASITETHKNKIDNSESVLNNEILRIFERETQKLDQEEARLTILNPLNVLGRGYALVTKKDSKSDVISNIKDAKNAKNIDITLSDGTISATVD